MSTPYRITEDLHCHSVASACCHDGTMTVSAIAAHRRKQDFQALAVTDHVWDVPGEAPDGRSAVHTVENLLARRENADIPADIRVLYGAEADYFGGELLSLRRENFALFDFVILALNHFPVYDPCRPRDVCAMERLQTERMTELLSLSLPWERIGLAHLSYFAPAADSAAGEAFCGPVAECAAARRDAITELARRGVGFELNPTAFRPGNASFVLCELAEAKAAGGRFYCASDAHSMGVLDRIFELEEGAIRPLALTERDRFGL